MTAKGWLSRNGRAVVILLWVAAALVLFSTASGYFSGGSGTGGAGPDKGIVKFRGIYHNVNKLLLHSSNMGFFGDWNS
ncbi:MAG TPA: hypothetical protein VMU02_07250, partial [bacterium]|nr:hypothetical protein [bacterium]